MTDTRYEHVVLGGTFDHLHRGHETLLSKAFSVGTRVYIGITTDRYVRASKYDEEAISGVACCTPSSHIQPFTVRKNQIEAWLTMQGVSTRAVVIPIDDMYGITLSQTERLDAIVVSTETRPNADRVNDKRKAMGLPQLAVIEIPLVPAGDAQPISATRIRNGEIDTEGNLIMPDTMRQTLALPIGTVLTDGDTEAVIRGDHDAVTVSVGDKTTERLLSNGLVPTAIIIDMQVERQPYTWDKTQWDMIRRDHEYRQIASGPGYISAQFLREFILWSATSKPTMYVITGEEDLLVLPVILYAPAGTVVYYGQPNVGIVRVVVTAKMKETVRNLLEQFIR